MEIILSTVSWSISSRFLKRSDMSHHSNGEHTFWSMLNNWSSADVSTERGWLVRGFMLCF
jgi:hypothetical protein